MTEDELKVAHLGLCLELATLCALPGFRLFRFLRIWGHQKRIHFLELALSKMGPQ